MLFQKPLLPLHGYGYLFKLAVTDDYGIVFACGDASAELLAVLWLKVLFRGDEDVGGRIQPEKLARPLFRQVVRYDEQGLVAETEALGFHGGGDHFKGLARANFVRKERIAAVKHMGDSV